ncbi:MAG: 4Fe-4S binding protein [Bacillota bacterium]
MDKVMRKIITIDEEKCDGCGLCIPSCAEGALQVIDGKARLVKDIYCDGLGNCIGECPRGAITVVEREAEPFNKKAVETHLKNRKSQESETENNSLTNISKKTLSVTDKTVFNAGVKDKTGEEGVAQEEIEPELSHWPVQLHLVNPQSRFLRNADLLFCADCVPFAYADFHRRFLAGRSLIIGCPKLDDVEEYHKKLVEIFRENKPEKLTLLMMDVGCCMGLSRLVHEAMEEAGVEIPVEEIIISVDGTIINR